MDNDILGEALLFEMAFGRDDYVLQLEYKLTGAIVHAYQVALTNKLGKSRWVQHWTSEVNRLLNEEFFLLILHDIKGFKNRRKAVEDAISKMKFLDKKWQTRAENHVKKCYKLNKLNVHIDENDTKRFWDKVEDIVNDALEN